MNLVNYGTPVHTISTESLTGGFRMEVVHNGVDNHHLMKRGEQCECGQINLGIARADPPPTVTCRDCGYGNTIDDIRHHEVPGAWWCARCGAIAQAPFGVPGSGPLDIGIERDSTSNRTNDFEIFFENFEGMVELDLADIDYSSGSEALDGMGAAPWLREMFEAPKRTRRERAWRWLKRGVRR